VIVGSYGQTLLWRGSLEINTSKEVG
jgi:hypothetical protein